MPLMNAGWFFRNSQGRRRRVGSRAPNRFGIHDKHGNVREWCADNWVGTGHAPPETGAPIQLGSDDQRATKGGAYNGLPRYLRSANRLAKDWDDANEHMGIRPIKNLFEH